MANQKRRRRLAVRPGDPGERKLGRRVAEEAGCRGRHRIARARDTSLRDAQVEPALDDERRRAGLDGGGREVVAVGAGAGDAEVERARPHLVAVVGEVRDLDVGIAGVLDRRGAGEDLAEPHRGRF